MLCFLIAELNPPPPPLPAPPADTVAPSEPWGLLPHFHGHAAVLGTLVSDKHPHPGKTGAQQNLACYIREAGFVLCSPVLLAELPDRDRTRSIKMPRKISADQTVQQPRERRDTNHEPKRHDEHKDQKQHRQSTAKYSHEAAWDRRHIK
jgi:hypothetical protein